MGGAWASGLLTAFLHGLSRTDPIAITAGPVLTVIAVAAAVWRPAVRAGRIDPVAAMRT